MKITALIMAGGRGERFWPKSRRHFPKQFLSLTDDGKTMIQLTVERILPIVDIHDIYIVTNSDYKTIIIEQLAELPEENILCEPLAKNTAPCIGLGAIHINKKYEDAIMLVLPSDHLIKYNIMFLNALRKACLVAKSNTNLVTIGITPSYPETGYGYIKFNPLECSDISEGAYKVEAFVEKPDLDKAREYLACEQYLWNSGMFIWKISSILKNIQTYMPETYKYLKIIADSIGTETYKEILKEQYHLIKSESIDYGIMERTTDIFIIPGTFGWDDVGSWLSVARIKRLNDFGNSVTGNVITVNTRDSIIEATDKLLAIVGVNNLIVVDTSDATLICDKNCTADIKKVIENLEICNRTEYI